MLKDSVRSKEKYYNEYVCDYCGFVFECDVDKEKVIDGAPKKKAFSSQVQCKRCGNFLQTWK